MNQVPQFIGNHDPADVSDYLIQFNDLLEAEENLNLVSVVIDEASAALGMTLGTGSYASGVTGKSIRFWLSCSQPNNGAFATGIPVIVTATITTTSTPQRRFERSVIVLVRETKPVISRAVPQPDVHQLQSMLTEARQVYHDWRLGKTARTYRDANGEEITYSESGLRGLSAYIGELERKIAAMTPGNRPSNAPMRVWF